MPIIELEVIVNAEIGIAPSEKGRVQQLAIAVSAEIDPEAVSKASTVGEIGHTLDYGLLRSIIHEVFEGKRFKLLEEPAILIKTLAVHGGRSRYLP